MSLEPPKSSYEGNKWSKNRSTQRISVYFNRSLFHKILPTRIKRSRNDRNPIPSLEASYPGKIILGAIYLVMILSHSTCVHISRQANFRVRRGTSATWSSYNPQLEPCPGISVGAMVLRKTAPSLVMAPNSDSNLSNG